MNFLLCPFSVTNLTQTLDFYQGTQPHALYWVPARNLVEARYLTAILNSPATTEAVSEYQSRGLFGARHFDTYVWRLPIPLFDEENPEHVELADLAAEAETVATSTDVTGLGFQPARKKVRAALDVAGLTEKLAATVSALFKRG